MKQEERIKKLTLDKFKVVRLTCTNKIKGGGYADDGPVRPTKYD